LAPLAGEFPLQAIQVQDEWLLSLPRLSSHPVEAYLPLSLADSLPHLERVLFLDADMLCLSDPRPLWETDLGGAVLGAVTDLAIPTFASPRGVRCWRQLGCPSRQPYFNAGVMLVDLKRWRSGCVTARALEYLSCHPVHFLHQEALNVVLRECWLPLAPKWNVISSLYQRRYSPPALSRLTRPALVHFAGRFKPWQILTHGWIGQRYRERWLEDLPFAPTWNGFWLGIYDRYLRDWFYPLERWCWGRSGGAVFV